MDDPRSHQPVWPEIRRLVPALYLPVLAVTGGMTIALPLVPLYLEDRGVGLTMVGFIMGATGVGAALAGVPASAFAERFGNDRLLFVAIVLAAVGLCSFGFTEAAFVLLLLRLVSGVGLGALGQSRQLFIARGVPLHFRGRVTSAMGGTHRLALAVGPVLGGIVAGSWGFAPAFVVAGGTAAVGLWFWVIPEGRERFGPGAVPDRVGVFAALRRHRRLVLTGGFGPLLIQAGREGRYVVIPLIADRLGLSIAEIGGLLAIGTVVDFVVFPLSGVLMDRLGRLYAIVPAFTVMACGMVLLGLAEGVAGVAAASVLIGLGNGVTSGAVLTLGADLAPEGEQGPYLAGFNLVSNMGLFVGPFVVGMVADLAGLGAAAFALGAILVAGVGWIALVVGETRQAGG